MTNLTDITADAVALQERDEFHAAGWLKLIAPAKVNLHLAIGAIRPDGYHEAVSIMHAINLHDVVYARRTTSPSAPNTDGENPRLQACDTLGTPSLVPDAEGESPRSQACNALGTPSLAPDADGESPRSQVRDALGTHSSVPGTKSTGYRECQVRMVACGDVEVPDVAPEDNIAMRALRELGAEGIELRIEKNIPAQAGLGGGSSDAAAALVAAAALMGLEPDDPAIERAARKLGADVAFFLHGGCACLTGAGDEFARALEPMKCSVALVKPAGGVSTAAAYRAFDEMPSSIPANVAENAAAAKRAEDIALFNNLAPASERLAPELAEVRTWLDAQPGVNGTLLCGSGAATFAVCSDFAAACAVVAGARKRGWWARATSFGSARAMIASGAIGAAGMISASGTAAAAAAVTNGPYATAAETSTSNAATTNPGTTSNKECAAGAAGASVSNAATASLGAAATGVGTGAASTGSAR